MSKKESGFTLIEIVMVLVLLGILMAVAAPKYFDLQEDALKQTAKAAVAEWQARFNAQFAKELLGDKDCQTARTDALTTMNAATEKNSIFPSDSKMQWKDGETVSTTAKNLTVVSKQSSKEVWSQEVVLPVCEADTP